MKPRVTMLYRLRRFAALLLFFFIAAALALPVTAHGAGKNVRVGWFESPFNSTDKFGRRSGYAYEYQQKLAAYSGWTYTYVSGSWPELMQMLADGKIDLLSDVSYTGERAEIMLFPEIPMGTEEYTIFISPGNREINPEDLSSLNVKRIGVNKGSIQADIFRQWAEQNGVQAEVVELTITEVDSLDMLDAGKLDAYITLNAYGYPDRLMPVCKIGASDFFFAVSKSRPDLLDDLNKAMKRIQDENPYYNQRMFESISGASGRTRSCPRRKNPGLLPMALSGWDIRTIISLFAPGIRRREN